MRRLSPLFSLALSCSFPLKSHLFLVVNFDISFDFFAWFPVVVVAFLSLVSHAVANFIRFHGIYNITTENIKNTRVLCIHSAEPNETQRKRNIEYKTTPTDKMTQQYTIISRFMIQPLSRRRLERMEIKSNID